jgi:secreted trypsin-like serine protease
LPAGASISAPSLTPPGLGSLTAAGNTYDATGTCEYTIEFPSTSNQASSDSISITYVESDSDLYFPTGVAGGITFTWAGQDDVPFAVEVQRWPQQVQAAA